MAIRRRLNFSRAALVRRQSSNRTVVCIDIGHGFELSRIFRTRSRVVGEKSDSIFRVMESSTLL